MRRRARWLAGVVLAVGLTGCVERRMLIVSDPPGATVFVNNENVGIAPVSVPFTYYGGYDITFVRDGYQTMTRKVKIRRPWFEFFPFDFFAENAWLGHIQDNRVLQGPEFTMQPLEQPRTEDVLRDANALRQRGVALPEPGNPTNN